MVQVGVLAVGLLRQIVAARHLRQEGRDRLAGEDLDGAVQAVLAVVQVHGLQTARQRDLAHRAPHSQDLLQALGEENGVDVKLDNPVVLCVPGQAADLLPHREQRRGVQRGVPPATQRDVQIDADDGHIHWQGLPDAKLLCSVCEDVKLVASKEPHALSLLIGKQWQLVAVRQREREAVQRNRPQRRRRASRPLLDVVPLPVLAARLPGSLPAGRQRVEARPPPLREEHVRARAVSEGNAAGVRCAPLPDAHRRQGGHALDRQTLPLNLRERVLDGPRHPPDVLELVPTPRGARRESAPYDAGEGPLQQRHRRVVQKQHERYGRHHADEGDEGGKGLQHGHALVPWPLGCSAGRRRIGVSLWGGSLSPGCDA
mmetsp:Transcript_149935/g.462858  ORF Transcript_149935/g.462858 Transcript_149935/m.462858 type:complete len:372 (-) Transcript_149935:368-1483(-)